jgi:uncharacterized protein (TIGR02266 family)
LTRKSFAGYDAQVSPAKGAPSRGTTDADERRQAPRVLVALEVDYALEENYLFAYITDISATGIFIRTVTPEPAGTHLNLRFSPPKDSAPDDRPFELEGEVIWVNPYRPGAPDSLHPGMGVRFHALSGDDRRRLIDLIRRIAYLT